MLCLRENRRLLRFVCPIVAMLAAWAGAVAHSAEPAADGDLFTKQVAPLLETRCLGCHSASQSRGKLSLESRAGLLRGGESGPAVVLGQPDESLLLDMISGDSPAMPEDGEPLSAADVASIREWIQAGARWPDTLRLVDKSPKRTWWSLEPLTRPAVPEVASAWPRNAVDRFVWEQLAARQLTPSPEADRRTLIRRLAFDLHGLPPTPDEIDAFVADASPDAYERLVDRLLASPRYGERWARRWLDVVHFGETHGYDKDKRRDHAWPYRDYVIAAFNGNQPYAQFVREQLAGDALWPDDPQAVIATGFIAAGPWDFVGHVELREDTVEKAKTRSLDRDDMLASTISTFTSMTAHCARCHDHKFDPIPQADYFALQAVFAGVERGDRPYPDPLLVQQRQHLTAALEERRQSLAAIELKIAQLTSPELARLDTALADLRSKLAQTVDPFEHADDAPVTSPANGYHSAISSTADATKWVQLDLGETRSIEAIRLLPARPTDFTDTPGFGFPLRFTVQVADEAGFAQPRVVFDKRDADFANPGKSPVTIYLDKQPARYVRVTAHKLWPRTGDFVFALGEMQVEAEGQNVARGAQVSALDSIDAGRWGTGKLVDGFDSRYELPELTTTPAGEQFRRRGDIERQLQQLTDDRAKHAQALITAELAAHRASAAEQVASTEKQLRELPKDSMVYAAISRTPREIRRLDRGNVEAPRELAAPGALSAVATLPDRFALSDPADEASRRVALAEWIVAEQNMLTWRSIANRVWSYHFGRGIVDTPNDLGRNGSLPTHPALLDWLAVEFREGGQSFKSLDRLLVTSAAYRQQSRHDAHAASIDGSNQFLWRANRQRLDAESFRDSLLAVSGKLDFAMGGPSFELFAFKDDHSPRYDPVPMDEPRVWRRTIYRYITRSVPNPLLETLDCPDPSFSAPVRGQTITALQALTTLNNALVLKQAEHFAARLMAEAPDTDGRVERAYRLALGRLPNDDERQAACTFIDQFGLPNFCRLLFNTNEFVFID